MSDPLFDGGLVLNVDLRLELRPPPLPAGALTDAERLLRDIASLEERRADEGEAGHVPDPQLRRLEAKLDLTLQLFAHALPQLAGPPSVRVHIGPRGLRMRTEAAATGVGTPAVLRWQPAEGVPLCLHLPVVVVRSRGGLGGVVEVDLAFDGLPDGLEDALARHLFRLHRRALAAQRRA